MTNNNKNGPDSTVTPPLRKHRFVKNSHQNLVTRNPTLATVKCSGRDRNQRVTTVKLWLIKGMVQVRLPKSRNVRGATYKSRQPVSTHVPMPISTQTQCLLPPDNTRLTAGVSTSLPDDACAKDAPDSNSTTCDETSVEANVSSYTFSRQAIRSNYMDKSIEAKKKVIRMLFVVVAEFFVCWAPLHVLNTWYLFSPEVVYKHVGSTGVSLVQLLAYISSCCNPITYCFMNRKFRQSFLGIFDCYHCLGGVGSCPSRLSGAPRDGAGVCAVGNNNSDVSGNESTVFAGRASGAGRSG
uniref:G-protein coupled receptors family 1 profile domain-containing protein n=1 Tax=Timema cristinae TaxID=61476 RepID=A0A7R9DGG7_TIMCR|nr:unnamed protein product [Timema cristinae]